MNYQHSLVWLVLLAGLVACHSSPDLGANNDQNTNPPIDDKDAECSIVEKGTPLTAGQHELMVAARSKVFGTNNVDQATGALPADKVILSWISVSGYAASFKGQVLLLDAFIGDATGYIPINNCELTDLRPSAVFIGHGHHDHARLLATVVNRNRGIQVYASEEVCIDLALATNGLVEPECDAVIPLAAPIGTAVERENILLNIDMTAIRLTHTAGTEPKDPADPSVIVPVPVYEKPEGAGPCFGPEESALPANAVTCPEMTSPNSVPPSTTEDGAISVMYQFRLPDDLNIAWFNSFGPSDEGDDMRNAVAALPQTDIQFGAILGFNGVSNGFLDARIATELLRSRLITPSHHDFLPGIRGKTFESAFFDEIEKIDEAVRPGIIFVTDPDHYLMPSLYTWDAADPVWSQTGPLPGDARPPVVAGP